MYISEGTPSGLFSSIMMKPPNVANVYPLRSESRENQTLLHLNASKKGPVVVFNTETLDPKSLLFSFHNKDHLAKFLRQLVRLNETYGDDFEVLVLHE